MGLFDFRWFQLFKSGQGCSKMKSALGAHWAQTQKMEKIQTLAKAPCLHLLLHRPRSRADDWQSLAASWFQASFSSSTAPRAERCRVYSLRWCLSCDRSWVSWVLSCLLQVSESKAGSTRGATATYCNIQTCLEVAMFNFTKPLPVLSACRQGCQRPHASHSTVPFLLAMWCHVPPARAVHFGSGTSGEGRSRHHWMSDVSGTCFVAAFSAHFASGPGAALGFQTSRAAFT